MTEIPEDILKAADVVLADVVSAVWRMEAVEVVAKAILAERERCAKIAEGYSAMAHATFDIKRENFPQKSPIHIFIASEIRGAQPMTNTIEVLKAAHTPGPWTADEMIKDAGLPYAPVYATTLIAKVYSTAFKDDPQAIANAKLTAAAPDLLYVAELVVSWLDEEEGAHALCDKARAAIRKATGGAA